MKSAGKERYGEKKRRKQREKAVSQRRQGLERLWSAIPRYALYAAVMAAIAVAAVWIWSRPSLPPTTMAGHTEELPGGYVLSTPMPEAIQRHMLEHADGKGRPRQDRPDKAREASDPRFVRRSRDTAFYSR